MLKKIQKLRFQSGFTLVELMIGMVIGLLATLVVMQTFSAFEGNKRSTTGVADAQTNGVLGLYLLQRELQYAGYGVPMVSGTMPTIAATSAANSYVFTDYTSMTSAQITAAIAAKAAAYNTKIAADATAVAAGVNFSALNCSSTSPAISLDIDGDTGTADATSIVRDIVSPVTIVDGANSDTVVVRYGTTTRGGMPTDIVSITGSTIIGVNNNMGCRSGDVALVTRDGSSTCQASMVTSTNAQLDATINTITLAANTGMAQLDKVSCLGKITQSTFDIATSANGFQLRKNTVPLIGDIVSLQAQYGVSTTANSEIVTGWQNGTGATWGAAMTVANRNRIKAVRIAVVARNNLLEKDPVTQLCTGTTTGPTKLCIFGGDLDLSGALGANWVNYRYRTYEIIVPLRNVLAASPQL